MTRARRGRGHDDRRRPARVLPSTLALVTLGVACAPPPDQVTVSADPGAPTTVVAAVGPPPVTASLPTPLLESPAALPSGPGVAPLAEPTPAERVDTSGSGTLVGHAIVPLVRARVAPDPEADEVAGLAHPTERGVPLVFQVLSPPSDGWVEVLLPVRPNGTTGWVRADELELTRNRYRLDLDVVARRLTVLQDDEVLVETSVAIGTGATPTPIGDFFLTELLRPPDPAGAYGPFAYGLSGFSETLDSFNGGPGIIGIHGTNRPDLLGTDVSHGCVRVHNDVIAEMATYLPLGTPVSIHRGRPAPPPPGLQ